MASPEASTGTPVQPITKSALPWILLALWVVWFAGMLWISRGQWGVSRVPETGAPVDQSQP